MVVPNRINAQLTEQNVDDILALVRSIRSAMPFLTGLSPKERQSLNKAGDASQAFIRRSLDTAPLIDSYLPRGMDIEELRKDVALMDALQPIMVAVSQLAELLDDTRALAASDAFAASLEVYRCAKKAQGTEGMEDVVRELSRRFARAGAGPEPEPEFEPAPVLAEPAMDETQPGAM